MIHRLSAFHGSEKEKQDCLNQVHAWLQVKLKPKTAEQIAGEIFNPVRFFNPSEFALENYEAFPENLGLPTWLANLMEIIKENNSSDFNGFSANYEESFYPAFVAACRVGVDYTMMFHSWEIMLLKEFLPEQERGKQYILATIALHEKALAGNAPEKKEWEKLALDIKTILESVDEFTGVPDEIGLRELNAFENLQAAKKSKIANYRELHDEAFYFQAIRKSYSEIIISSGRVAYLSILDYLDPYTSYTSSADAIVDLAFQLAVNKEEKMTTKEAKEYRQKIWSVLINKLLSMLQGWE